QLIAPSVSVVNITDPNGNLIAAETAAGQAQRTAKGRARLALSAALADTPGWFTPLSPEPAAHNYKAQEANQFMWGAQVTFPFAFALRADLEARAGGNPSWNTGVNYFRDLLKSTDLKEVLVLYHAAGLSLSKDLAETITAAKVRLNRVRDGEWNALSLTPALLKARASALGPKYNVFSSNGTLVATPPVFLRFTPPRYLRPFDAPAP